MKNLILPLGLAALMLAACGKKEEAAPESTGPAGNTQQTQPATPPATTPPTDQPAPAEQPATTEQPPAESAPQ